MLERVFAGGDEKMNHMKQVAEMLGVEIDEVFSISNTRLIYKFTNDGLLKLLNVRKSSSWCYDNNMLRCLLSGECQVSKIKWDGADNTITINIKDKFKDDEKSCTNDVKKSWEDFVERR